MRRKILPVVVALILILIVAAVGFGGRIMEKYSYSDELVDLDEYFGVKEGELAIILQDEIISHKAILKNGEVYFDWETVADCFNEGFYADRNEQKLLYTTANDTVTAVFGAGEYSDREGTHAAGYEICFVQGEQVYLAAEYVRLFSNFAYTVFDRHLQVYTEWGTKEIMDIARDTQVRREGDIKSPILREMTEGETVEVLDLGETWSKVKTSDSLIGYVENKRMDNLSSEIEEPVTDYIEEEYTSISMEGKVSLGFHSIGGEGGNATLGAMLAESKGINVIAPTWFSLTDNEGNFRSFGSAQYVEEAHGKGLQVWGVWDNFNYRNETGTEISSYQVLSSTAKRQKLEEDMVNMALELGLDGVNIDFEGLTQDCGEHYIQFLRELSVLCRNSSLVLSVDNYVPMNFNNYYRLDIQGKILDYVIIMGYDEHWRGSGDPGSVASISYVSGGLDRTLEQVPASKVVNALPFYMILWKTEGTEVTDEYITISYLEEYLRSAGVELTWDETTCQNYGEWQSGAALYQIWAEDQESIGVKLNVMNARNIGGVAVWRLGYGTAEVWKLIEAYVNL